MHTNSHARNSGGMPQKSQYASACQLLRHKLPPEENDRNQDADEPGNVADLPLRDALGKRRPEIAGQAVARDQQKEQRAEAREKQRRRGAEAGGGDPVFRLHLAGYDADPG